MSPWDDFGDSEPDRRCDQCGGPLDRHGECLGCDEDEEGSWAPNTDHKTSLWDADEEDE